jgi:hypothetical protein
MQNRSARESDQQIQSDGRESDVERRTIYFRLETNSNDRKLEELKAPRPSPRTAKDNGAAGDSGAA